MTARMNPLRMGAVPQFRSVGGYPQQAMVGDVAFDFPYGNGGGDSNYPLQGPYFRPDGLNGQVPPTSMTPPGCLPNPCMPGGYGDPRIMQAWWQQRCLEREAQARRAVLANQRASAPKHAMGLNSIGDIAAGDTVTLTTEPTVLVCAVDYKIPRDVTPFFLIVAITIAQENYVITGDPVPADNFATDATCCHLMAFRTISPGTPVSVTVQNIDADPRRFLSALWVLRGRDMDTFRVDYGSGNCV